MVLANRMGVVDFLPVLNLPARNWDVVLTCFEPLVSVTGGIGTYHRLLLEELADDGRNVLILTRGHDIDDGFLPHVTKINVDELDPAKRFNFVGLDHEYFSLHCHFALRALYETGHRFGLVEFPDYGGDGFYPLRARAAGMYEFGVAAVRLHSPNVMLVEDNGGAHFNLDCFHRDQVDREMSVYQDADVILFGGDAMRDRVLQLAKKFGIDIADKMIKCPHPYPRHLFQNAETADQPGTDTARTMMIRGLQASNRFAHPRELEKARFIGVFGRIEDRKGQFQMFWQALHDPDVIVYLKATNVHFVIAGHNVLDHIGNFKLNDLYSLIHQRNLQSRFHFTGRLSQEVLAEYSRAVSGYIFPSVFENYPNALLEVLPTCRPVAISVHGCMPEITRGFANITLIDPKRLDPKDLIAFLRTVPDAVTRPDLAEFCHRVAVFEDRQRQMKAYYTKAFSMPNVQRATSLPSLGVVIPVYQDSRFLADAIETARQSLRVDEPIVVVDDGSIPEAGAEIARVVGEAGAQLIVLPENSGPAIARLRGVQALSTDLVQLCDGDDLLEPVGVASTRLMFARDPELSMATGVMSCFQDADHCWVPRNGNLWTATEANFAHSGSMYRREALLAALAVQHERLPLNEDWLMNLLILAHGGKCRMTPEITYHYRRFEGTRSTQNQALVGRITQQINHIVSNELTFGNREMTSRLCQIYAAYINASTPLRSAPAGRVPLHYYPLRYQYLDAMFFRFARLKGMERILLGIKRRIVERRKADA